MEGKSSAVSNIAPVASTCIPRYNKDDEHKPVIVCALTGLPVPSNVTQPPEASKEPKWQRRTFWTECANCKEKKKFPITDLACQVVCPACTETFTAIEVARPRNTSLNSKEKLESSSAVVANSSLQSTAVIPIADVAYHTPKNVRTVEDMTLAVGKDREKIRGKSKTMDTVGPCNLKTRTAGGGGEISKAFPTSAVNKLLQARMKEILEKKLNDRQAKDKGQ